MIATYYTAPWCAPCKTFKPQAAQRILAAGIQFIEWDVEKKPTADIYTLPTIIFRDDNDRIVAQVNGNNPKGLSEAISAALR